MSMSQISIGVTSAKKRNKHAEYPPTVLILAKMNKYARIEKQMLSAINCSKHYPAYAVTVKRPKLTNGELNCHEIA